MHTPPPFFAARGHIGLVNFIIPYSIGSADHALPNKDK